MAKFDVEALKRKYLSPDETKKGGSFSDNKEYKVLSLPEGTEAVVRFIMPEDWDEPFVGFGMHYSNKKTLPLKRSFVCPRGHKEFVNTDYDKVCPVCQLGSDIYNDLYTRLNAGEKISDDEVARIKRSGSKYLPKARAWGVMFVEKILRYPDDPKDKEKVEKIELRKPYLFGLGLNLWKSLYRLIFAVDEKGDPIKIDKFSDEIKEPWIITDIEEGAFFIFSKEKKTGREFAEIILEPYSEKTSLYSFSLGSIASGKFTKKEVKALFENIPSIRDELTFPTTEEEIAELAEDLLVAKSDSDGTEKYGNTMNMTDVIGKMTSNMD